MRRETDAQKAARLGREAKTARKQILLKYRVGQPYEFTYQGKLLVGYLDRKAGEFFTFRHPNGGIWTVEQTQVRRQLKTLPWPGLCDNLIRQSIYHPDVALQRFEDARKALEWIMETGSDNQKNEAKKLLDPLVHAMGCIAQHGDRTVYVFNQHSHDHEYLVEFPDTPAEDFCVPVIDVGPLDKPSYGVGWYRVDDVGHLKPYKTNWATDD